MKINRSNVILKERTEEGRKKGQNKNGRMIGGRYKNERKEEINK
jgi:hypothetical protein